MSLFQALRCLLNREYAVVPLSDTVCVSDACCVVHMVPRRLVDWPVFYYHSYGHVNMRVIWNYFWRSIYIIPCPPYQLLVSSPLCGYAITLITSNQNVSSCFWSLIMVSRWGYSCLCTAAELFRCWLYSHSNWKRCRNFTWAILSN